MKGLPTPRQLAGAVLLLENLRLAGTAAGRRQARLALNRWAKMHRPKRRAA